MTFNPDWKLYVAYYVLHVLREGITYVVNAVVSKFKIR